MRLIRNRMPSRFSKNVFILIPDIMKSFNVYYGYLLHKNQCVSHGPVMLGNEVVNFLVDLASECEHPYS